jgi:hypothetical protein
MFVILNIMEQLYLAVFCMMNREMYRAIFEECDYDIFESTSLLLDVEGKSSLVGYYKHFIT